MITKKNKYKRNPAKIGLIKFCITTINQPGKMVHLFNFWRSHKITYHSMEKYAKKGHTRFKSPSCSRIKPYFFIRRAQSLI